MEVKTYRAATMHEALAMVRRELGPDAAVLHTREFRNSRFFGLIAGPRQIEVTASAEVNVKSRLPASNLREEHPLPDTGISLQTPPPALRSAMSARAMPAEDMHGQLNDLRTMVKELCSRSRSASRPDLPDALFRLYTDLIDADLNEDLARELLEQVRGEARGAELADPLLVKARIAGIIEAEIAVTGPIAVQAGSRRLVALVGPTGVGKTTTIAKLAAHYRLKEKRRVGLITVDTYRIAAVEQLRTYADIIDLPMQVVSTPREMREAVRRMDNLELVLMDTAGRSPKDDVKIRELRAFLSEAGADEVHLVLSSVGNPKTMEQTALRFAPVGTTALLLTKLDEASGLGNLLPLLRRCKLPLSYLTNGQNVPDDIETADPQRLSRLMIEMDDELGNRS
jgi:flagellar biosynthesis protein FlhF